MAAPSTKQVFLVVADSQADKVEERLTSLGVPMFKVTFNSWFVAYSGTASEASEDFGMRSENVVGTGVVVSVNNYGGRASPDMWEWLKLNWPANA